MQNTPNGRNREVRRGKIDGEAPAWLRRRPCDFLKSGDHEFKACTGIELRYKKPDGREAMCPNSVNGKLM